MTKQEYDLISKKDFFEIYNFDKYYYRYKALKTLKKEIELMKLNRPGIQIHLHHKLEYLDKLGYEFWGFDGNSYIGLELLYKDDHSRIHTERLKKMQENNKGSKRTDRSKKLISKKLLGNTNGNGKRSVEFSIKSSERQKNKVHWWNNGIIQVFQEICPEGFISGQCNRKKPKSFTENHKLNIGKSHLGLRYNKKLNNNPYIGVNIGE